MGRFDVLSDLEFEELVADLLRADTGLPYRAGTRGPDGRVDVLAVVGPERHVAQCKHVRTGQIGQVLREARAEAEALRVRRLRPDSYRFVTSMRLNHRRREEVAEILDPWIGGQAHVLGEGDLDALLREHSAVEARHVKLWLGGLGVLRRALHGGAYERSLALVEETRAKLPRYVQTRAFLQARELLHRQHVCVIAGPPGVGKTTLARLLMIDALEQGYQPYDIPQGELRQAWSLIDPDERQLFLYDDFLGRIELVPGQEDDEHLMRFMRHVARAPNARIVLTTREYVLRQAQRLSEVLERESSDLHRFLLLVEHYSRHEKARILYNHVYFSDQVDEAARRSLLAARGYLRVIDHPGYSPRLIEWMTSSAAGGLDDAARRDYASYCLHVLDHPEQLWQHAFERGLGDAEKALLLCLVSLPDEIEIRDLERAFGTACRVRAIAPRDQRFYAALKILLDSFLTTRHMGDKISVGPINPSLLDFLTTYTIASVAEAELVLAGAVYFEQVAWLWRHLARAGEPPAELVPAFAKAFEATFENTVELLDSDFRIPLNPRHPLVGITSHRLELILDAMQECPALALQLDDWPRTRAASWANGGFRWVMSSEVLSLVERLVSLGILDEQVWSRCVKPVVLASRRDDRWELALELRGRVTDAIAPAEWAELQREFAAHAAELLSAALDGQDPFIDLDELESLATAMEVALDEEAVRRTRELIEDTPDPDPYLDDDWREFESGLREGRADDGDIDAMFERLGND